jgi:HSP20 family protein
MALIPWKPFFDLDKFFEDEDWLLPVFPRTELAKPAMDLYETDKEVVAELNIPDFNPENVEITVENDVLTVKGKMDEKKEEKEKGYWRKEIRRGSFERMVRLPVAIKQDAVEASYNKGVLKIVMPKAQAQSGSKIKVQVKEK